MTHLVQLDELLEEILLDEGEQVDSKICLVDLVDEDNNNLNQKVLILKIYSEEVVSDECEGNNNRKETLKQNKNLSLSILKKHTKYQSLI
jgi:hypothetical protein